jgi:hypothetical protein
MAASPAQTEIHRMNGKAIAARSQAMKRLIEAYPEEFGGYLVEERTSRGLSPTSGGESTNELIARVEKAEAKLKAARETLAARGVTAPVSE